MDSWWCKRINLNSTLVRLLVSLVFTWITKKHVIWLKGKSTSSLFFFLISHSQSSLIEVCCISVLFLRTLQLCLVMNTEVLIRDLLLIVLLVLLRANLHFSLIKMHPPPRSRSLCFLQANWLLWKIWFNLRSFQDFYIVCSSQSLYTGGIKSFMVVWNS